MGPYKDHGPWVPVLWFLLPKLAQWLIQVFPTCSSEVRSPISEERVLILRPPLRADFSVPEYVQAGGMVGLLLPPLFCLLQENSEGVDSPALMVRTSRRFSPGTLASPANSSLRWLEEEGSSYGRRGKRWKGTDKLIGTWGALCQASCHLIFYEPLRGGQT